MRLSVEGGGEAAGARRRRPGRPKNEREDGQTTEAEIRDFLTASGSLTSTDEKNELCWIVAHYEPDTLGDDPVLTVDLAKLKTETVTALIDFVKARFKRLGRVYPDG
jgi:hypothetical protein